MVILPCTQQALNDSELMSSTGSGCLLGCINWRHGHSINHADSISQGSPENRTNRRFYIYIKRFTIRIGPCDDGG